ncbi:2,5-diketo-D-gluconic acid reductase [Paenibacillus polymyxa]|nr:2,5-diketo-D-gluconic acid reductase [Paenibacillus polymyxa]
MKEYNVQIESNMFHNGVLVSLAEKYQKSVAQVILRWLTQREVVVVPKSVHKELLKTSISLTLI